VTYLSRQARERFVSTSNCTTDFDPLASRAAAAAAAETTDAARRMVADIGRGFELRQMSAYYSKKVKPPDDKLPSSTVQYLVWLLYKTKRNNPIGRITNIRTCLVA
jgi:hypothetical protein